VQTYIPQQPGRSARSYRRRLAGITAVSALAVSLAAWGASGSAASSAPTAPIVPGAESRVIGNGTDSYAPVVAKVAPAVVTVRSERRAHATQQRLPFLDDPRFREFFGDRFGEGVPTPGPQPRQGGLGSGVVVNKDGYVLTNHHVIAGADKVKVELQDRRVFDATIIGSDEPSDLAVLKIDATQLPVVPFGDSEIVNVGDVVLALGNPMGVGQTVTMGIISAKGRATGLGDGSFEDFLQTDAPINTGNSGGALVNTRGELVGINSQILSPSGGNIGIGFAIPVNMARTVMDALINDGEVRRGRLGVTIQPVTSDLAASLQLAKVGGALVNDVQTGSAADRAGIRRGDAIVALNGQDIADTNELRNRIAQLGPDASVELTVVRNGEMQTVKATLEALPSNTAARNTDTPADERTAGLVVEPLTPQRARQMGLSDNSGLLVTSVSPDGPAAEAGIRTGDVIRQVDGQTLSSADELRRALSGGDRPALVLVRRGDQSIFVPLPRLG
jgi:Do/DeqQ family serine protease